MNANALNRLTHYRAAAAQNLKEARETLAADAQPPRTTAAHDLARVLALLAQYEGQLHVLDQVLALVEAGKDDQINAWLVTQATRGAEDTWSGRTNDAARSRFDGVLDAVRKVSETLAAF